MSTKKQRYDEPDLSVADLTRALYESNLKLDGITREQNEFFSNISHDLRSPIAAIRSAIEYLEETPDIEQMKKLELYGLIDRKASSLEHMIEEIFLLTKLSTTATILKPELIPCGNYLEDFFFTNQADTKYSSVELKLDVPLEFDYFVEIDPYYFDRVLNNLFDNAFRHLGDGGYIRLSASVDDSGSNVNISVSDNGSGIKSEDIPKVFDRTFTGSASRTPTVNSGAGLGLSICKKIVEILGGTITCKSKTGSDHGTTFTITLPVTASRS